MSDPRTVLILTAGTGGGHRSVAEALAEALAARGIRAVLAEPLGPPVDRIYNWLLRSAPAIWGGCYRLTDRPALCLPGMAMVRARRGAALARLIAVEGPDLVLSVHALCAHAAAGALGRGAGRIPHHCVVTDLVDIHRSWIVPGVDRYYAPTSHAAVGLRRGGAATAQIRQTGLPVRAAFADPPAVDWPCAEPALRILLMDGGVPGPAIGRALAALAAVGPPLDIRVVVGAYGLAGGPPLPSMPPRHTATAMPQGLCLAGWMAAADLVVTKAGSVTIAEAMALGRPLLLHRAVPAQEASNPWLVEWEGVGLHAPRSATLRAAVELLAARPELRLAMARRAIALSRPGAAGIVADAVGVALGIHAAHEQRPRGNGAAIPV